jgi:diguanylate cyclase (GGDEF)-like protein
VQQSGAVEILVHGVHRGRRTCVARWTHLVDHDGVHVGYVGTIEDVTERKALEARLSFHARHDVLTGLPNRTVLKERLVTALARTNISGDRTAVMFCDLDNFKVVNDSMGHDTGDRLLVAVAKRLSEAFRDAQVVSRFGGDEFVVLAPDLEPGASPTWYSERFDRAFTDPFDIGIGSPYICSASVGLAVAQSGASAESILRDADAAMYLAKRNGRGRVELFQPSARNWAVDRLALEGDLRKENWDDEMRVVYQPIIDAVSGELVSIEALVRWEHPTRGLISPDAFIPIAEETGDILSLGQWVLERACRDVLVAGARNAQIGAAMLSVNLSARQLHESDLIDRISQSLVRSGFPPRRLILEVTESLLVTDMHRTSSALTSLQGFGVSIAVDDFGTGYSSLSYLSSMPLDILKIDRSFVQSIDQPGGDIEIVRAILALAHALGLQTTAEGVETAAQLVTLREMGCSRIQGYLIGRPGPMEALIGVS